MKIEWPDYALGNEYSRHWVREKLNFDLLPTGTSHYTSIAELYLQIREGFKTIKDVIIWPKHLPSDRGTWNLFVSKTFAKKNPLFDASVNNLEQAIYAIDLIREQGEGKALSILIEKGASPTAEDFKESHFYRFFNMYLEFSDIQRAFFVEHPELPPWEPSYPGLNIL